jgi:hypothetical protein
MNAVPIADYCLHLTTHTLLSSFARTVLSDRGKFVSTLVGLKASPHCRGEKHSAKRAAFIRVALRYAFATEIMVSASYMQTSK